MKYLMTFLLCMLITVITTAQSVGPSSLNASGGSAVVSGNTFEYAIGDLLTTTYTSSSLVVTQGVLQPMPAPTGISTPGIAASDLSVFPNPASGYLFLQPGFSKGGVLEYLLLDATGKTVLQRSVTLTQGNERQEIVMTPFAAGQYMLQVQWRQQGQTYMNAYKVQKLL